MQRLLDHRRRLSALLATGAAATLAGPALAAGPHGAHDGDGRRLVVRGDDTLTELACGPGGVCEAHMTGGTFRGPPVGTGGYEGVVRLAIAEAFDNGEGGQCAPVSGAITLGAGTPNRLVLSIDGTSCQDGGGNPTQSSFTGLMRFKVQYGTGSYAGSRGGGVATILEDAADHERMTLVGRLRT
jgi:hypothetical protein